MTELERQNNQRLLAAAPALLSALIDMTDRYTGLILSDYTGDPEKHPEVKAARAAIASASRHHPPMVLTPARKL